MCVHPGRHQEVVLVPFDPSVVANTLCDEQVRVVSRFDQALVLQADSL